MFDKSGNLVTSTLAGRSLANLASPKHDDAVGHGFACGHHGEIIQGATRLENRSIQRFLVTMPCPDLAARARFKVSHTLDGEVLAPSEKGKSRNAAQITLRHLNQHALGGYLSLSSNIEEGFGLGSSTTDVVATIRAVADAFGVVLAPELIAQLAVEAEGASDAIMFDTACVLFAQRQGKVLSYLGNALPALHVLSVNTASDAPVDTLATPAARYTDWELQSFRALTGMLRRAVRTADANLLGRVATASAQISQRHLPKPAFADILQIARAHRACGVQVSHSGTVAGLLFDAHMAGQMAAMDGAARDLASIAMAPDFRFSTQVRRLDNVS